MTDKEFLSKIEGTVNDVCECIITREEATKSMMELFLQLIDPAIKSKQHLQLFIYRVQYMRGLQQQYFKGNKKVIGESMKAENLVDVAITTMLEQLGYSIDEIKAKYEQKKMF